MNALQRLDAQFEATFNVCFPSATSDGARALVQGNGPFAALLTFAVLRALLARAFWLNRRNVAPIALPQRAIQPPAPVDPRWGAVPVFTPGGAFVSAYPTGPLFNKETGERVDPPQPIAVEPVAQTLKTTRSRWPWASKQRAQPAVAPATNVPVSGRPRRAHDPWDDVPRAKPRPTPSPKVSHRW